MSALTKSREERQCRRRAEPGPWPGLCSTRSTWARLLGIAGDELVGLGSSPIGLDFSTVGLKNVVLKLTAEVNEPGCGCWGERRERQAQFSIRVETHAASASRSACWTESASTVFLAPEAAAMRARAPSVSTETVNSTVMTEPCSLSTFRTALSLLEMTL